MWGHALERRKPRVPSGEARDVLWHRALTRVPARGGWEKITRFPKQYLQTVHSLIQRYKMLVSQTTLVIERCLVACAAHGPSRI